MLKLIRGLISIATWIGVAYVTWIAYRDNSWELAAVAFSVAATGRVVLMAWLRRNADVSAVFKTTASGFIRTPLQEFAFMAPLYMAPGLWTQLGMWTFVAVPGLWVVLRATVRFMLGDKPGKA